MTYQRAIQPTTSRIENKTKEKQKQNKRKAKQNTNKSTKQNTNKTTVVKLQNGSVITHLFPGPGTCLVDDFVQRIPHVFQFLIFLSGYHFNLIKWQTGKREIF